MLLMILNLYVFIDALVCIIFHRHIDFFNLFIDYGLADLTIRATIC